MEEMFILKKYGKFSLHEQLLLSAEERSWFVTRFNKDIKRQDDPSSKK